MKKLILLLILTLITTLSFSQFEKKITYYENGNKKELLHRYSNKLNGVCIAWNDSGDVIGKVHYIDGLKHGKWFIWRDNGKPAYKFYYNQGKKVGVWKFYDESGKLIGEKEYEPIYKRNTLITFGTFTMSDISIGVTQRFNKNKLFAIGGEYSTYIADGENESEGDFKQFSKHCILSTAGLIGNEWAILVKAGTYFGKSNSYPHENYAKFDYGSEMLLYFNDDEMNISPVFGFSVTKGMGVQMNFGICF